ncbi:STAS-like domain-containing protein [Patescibacteria group bacterium]|nr:STAS-like domain-containing protein [Patescibacteria group bacterium]
MSTRSEIIANFITKHGSVTSADVAAMLKMSRQQAHAILRGQVQTGGLIKIGHTRGTRYVRSESTLPAKDQFSLDLKNLNLREHEVLIEIRDRFLPLKLASENVQSIFDYTFSEMLNNAIDHSESEKISVSVFTTGDASRGEPTRLSFVIRDWGIGVFRNVMRGQKLSSELEAMQDLLKGKITTAPEAHSGQGIFFTSRVADLFSLRSYGWEMRIDNQLPDIFFLPNENVVQGTEVRFSLTYRSKKHLIDVFRAFESEDGLQDFDRTEVHVRLFIHGTIHVSRSQARRVLTGLERFKRITLDFERVPTIGQAFADEIFRVFQTRYPGIHIEILNANEAVQFMINRVDHKVS